MKRPSLLLYLTEIPRAVWERIRSAKYMKKFTPKVKGDGHPVFFVPGFMASDNSTKILRKFLNRIGYKTFGWGLGMNLGNLDDLEILSQKLKEIHQKEGRKVTLIGWSLGGVYARELAKENPLLIRQVFTMGSPFKGIKVPNNATWLFRLIHGRKAEEKHGDKIEQIPIPPVVPVTAIYSKKDGIVPWQACMENPENDLHENREVRGSHFGLGVNRDVLEIIVEKISVRAAAFSEVEPD